MDGKNVLDELWIAASPDERRVLLMVAQRLIGAGQAVYGRLDLRNDRRDFAREAGEELVDAAIYGACLALKATS